MWDPGAPMVLEASMVLGAMMVLEAPMVPGVRTSDFGAKMGVLEGPSRALRAPTSRNKTTANQMTGLIGLATV